MNNKAVALFSGGLDSILAIKLMIEQGIEIHALNFSSVFCIKSESDEYIRKAAQALNIPVTILNITEELTKIVKNPRFGMGKNMNPCIDCRIFSFKKAEEFMKKTGASFIVTGEVVGERPMSQTRKSIVFIEKESGLEGLLVRPLSAKLLEPSIAEQEGIVDRSKLMDINGRSREQQIALAERFDILEYPNPAGGCLLTDIGFSRKLKDILKHNPDCATNDLELLKSGRQFRTSEEVVFFVGRNEKDNEKLITLAKEGDHIFDVVDIPSPIALARGKINDQEIKLIASVIARYSDAKSNQIKVTHKTHPKENTSIIITPPAKEKTITSLRI